MNNEPMTPERLAQKFHEVYERLAPNFGYETRKDTRSFDPQSPNGKLMIAVCGELLMDNFVATRQRETDLIAEVERLKSEREQWPKTKGDRDKLFALVQSVGVTMQGKWLSEAAIEAVERLKGDIAAFHFQLAAAQAREEKMREALEQLRVSGDPAHWKLADEALSDTAPNPVAEDAARCPECGYTKKDCDTYGDHKLCSNYGFFSWEKSGTGSGE